MLMFDRIDAAHRGIAPTCRGDSATELPDTQMPEWAEAQAEEMK